MHVRRIAAAAPFAALEAEWRALQAAASPPNFFLSWEWLSTWWRHQPAPADPFLLAVEDDAGQLCGIAPLMRVSRPVLGWGWLRVLTIMGTDAACSDHMTFLSRAGQEAVVTTAICRYLLAHQQAWDLLDLPAMPLDGPGRDVVRRYFGPTHLVVDTTEEICPYLPLEGSWEAYLASQSRNFRQGTRYKRRLFQRRADGSFHRATSAADIERLLPHLFEWNPARWEEKGRDSAFAEPWFQGFHHEVALTCLERGWLDLTWLEAEGAIAAVIYSFRFGNRVFFYNSAWNSEWGSLSPGAVLMGHCVEESFDDGLEEYDFLAGAAGYKYHWTDRERRDRGLMVIPRGSRAMLWYRLRAAAKGLRRQAREHLPDSLRERLQARLGR